MDIKEALKVSSDFCIDNGMIDAIFHRHMGLNIYSISSKFKVLHHLLELNGEEPHPFPLWLVRYINYGVGTNTIIGTNRQRMLSKYYIGTMYQLNNGETASYMREYMDTMDDDLIDYVFKYIDKYIPLFEPILNTAHGAIEMYDRDSKKGMLMVRRYDDVHTFFNNHYIFINAISKTMKDSFIETKVIKNILMESTTLPVVLINIIMGYVSDGKWVHVRDFKRTWRKNTIRVLAEINKKIDNFKHEL